MKTFACAFIFIFEPLLALFLIIVNQSAFIFEFRRSTCVREKNLTGFKGIYPFTHQAPVNIIPYNSLYGNFYSMNPMFAKGGVQVNLKKNKNEGGNMDMGSVLCHHVLLFSEMKALSIDFMRCRKTKRGSALFIMQEISMKSILTEYQRKYPAKSHPLRATCGNRNRRFRHFHFFYNLLYGIINVQSSQLRCKETFIES